MKTRRISYLGESREREALGACPELSRGDSGPVGASPLGECREGFALSARGYGGASRLI